MDDHSAAGGLPPKVPDNESLVAFWSTFTEVEGVLAGLMPLAWEESDWSRQPEATREAVALIAKWALRRALAAWLKHWCRIDPVPSQSLNHQLERGRLFVIPREREVLDMIDREIQGRFEILNQPWRSDLARDAFLIACGIRTQISQNTILVRSGDETKAKGNQSSGPLAGGT